MITAELPLANTVLPAVAVPCWASACVLIGTATPRTNQLDIPLVACVLLRQRANQTVMPGSNGLGSPQIEAQPQRIATVADRALRLPDREVAERPERATN